MRRLLFIVMFLLVLRCPCSGAVVAFEYTITVTEVTGWAAALVAVDDIVRGSFSYETNQVDTTPDPTFGEYYFPTGASSAEMHLASNLIGSDFGGRMAVNTDWTWSLDVMHFSEYFADGGYLYVEFQQTTGPDGVPPDYFPNDRPPVTLDLAAFPYAVAVLSRGGAYLQGSITSLAQVPEPSLNILVCVGLTAVLARRRRSPLRLKGNGVSVQLLDRTI